MCFILQVYSGAHGRTMIFTRTKAEANELALSSSLKQDCQVLHGDIQQKQREITLKVAMNCTDMHVHVHVHVTGHVIYSFRVSEKVVFRFWLLQMWQLEDWTYQK